MQIYKIEKKNNKVLKDIGNIMITVVDSKKIEIGSRKSLLTLQLEKTTVKTWSYLLEKIKKDKFIDLFLFLDGSSPVSQDLGFNKLMYQNAKIVKLKVQNLNFQNYREDLKKTLQKI